MVLQRRAPGKETWPGLWDVSVAGHYSAGEGIEGGLREIHEELGLAVPASDLVQAGRRRDDLRFPNGVIEREVQDIFFLLRDLDLSTVRTDPAEVSGVAAMPAATLRRLATGHLSRVLTHGGSIRADGGASLGKIVIQSRDLVPRAGRYYEKATAFAETLARGANSARRRWW